MEAAPRCANLSAVRSSGSSGPGARAPSPFGRLLRQWRALRGASQLHLATAASTSTRHLSFLETGRSRPSREMVLRLAEALDVPLRERNALLAAAGFAALYRESALDAPELEAVERVYGFLLASHEPYPAYLVDRSFGVVRANRAAGVGFGRFAGDAPVWRETPLNLLRVTLHPDGLRPWIQNWEEVAAALLARLQRELAYAGRDDALLALLEGLLALPDLPERVRLPDLEGGAPPVLPLHLKRDDLELRLFSAVTALGTPQDVTLQELHIESFFPADAASEERLRELGRVAAGAA